MERKAPYIRILIAAAMAMALCAQPLHRASAQAGFPGQTISDPYGDMQRLGTNPLDNGTTAGSVDNNQPPQSAQRDTTKRRPRKPLESYFFDDSTRKMPNFAWNVDMSRNRLNMTVIDTSMLHAQLDAPYLREDVGDAIIGPLGAGSIPLNAARRPEFRDWEFAQILYSYMYDPENVPFYNVKKPFTQLSYFTAGQKKYAEETLWITHAQNISPSTGFNVNYRARGTLGTYNWQGARAKNLSLAFNHTGKRYTIHAGYIYNNALIRENGGLVNDIDLAAPASSVTGRLPENIPTRMGNSSTAGDNPRNVFKNNRYYLVQSMGFPLSSVGDEDFSIAGKSTIFIGNSIDYSRFTRKYTDGLAGTLGMDSTKNPTIPYFDNWFIHPTMTNDSIFESKLSARFFMQLQPWDRESILGVIDGGIGIDNHLYYQFAPENYITGNNSRETKTSWYVYGSAAGQFRKYLLWDADAQYVYGGYRSGDYDLAGELKLSAFIKGRPISLTGHVSQSLISPGYWITNYFSNHFIWSNPSFAKESQTKLEVSLKVPSIGLEARAFQNLYLDKIYFGPDAMPAQAGGSTSLTGLYLEENIPLGILHLNHRIIVQTSSDNTVIPVPLAAAYLSYFMEFNVVKNVLRLQLGFDGWYTTPYYGFGYNPAVAQFYNQREQQLGGFPMINFFVSAKWKRMRIIAQVTHLNQGFVGSDNTFDVLHYPLNQRVFKLGISWSFYD